MIALVASLLALSMPTQEPGELLDIARHGTWSLITEGNGASLAVFNSGDRTAQRGDLWMIATLATPQELGSGPGRQILSRYTYDCVGRTIQEGLLQPVDPTTPGPRAYKLDPKSNAVPIVAVPPPPQRVREGTPAAAGLNLVCPGVAFREYPTVEGEWATVLQALLDRSDAR